MADNSVDLVQKIKLNPFLHIVEKEFQNQIIERLSDNVWEKVKKRSPIVKVGVIPFCNDQIFVREKGTDDVPDIWMPDETLKVSISPYECAKNILNEKFKISSNSINGRLKHLGRTYSIVLKNMHIVLLPFIVEVNHEEVNQINAYADKAYKSYYWTLPGYISECDELMPGKALKDIAKYIAVKKELEMARNNLNLTDGEIARIGNKIKNSTKKYTEKRGLSFDDIKSLEYLFDKHKKEQEDVDRLRGIINENKF